MDTQIKKGVLEMCVLQSLSREPQYGYTLMQGMHTYFPDIPESTFYAVLRRLHREGALESYEGAVSGGPPRKYYRLTPQGVQALHSLVCDWQELNGIARALGISDG